MSSPLVHYPAHLTLHAAKLAADACVCKANSLDVPMNIAVVDTSLYLLYFERMPGAKLTSVDVAISKAFTAAGHRAPTSIYEENFWPRGPAFGLNASNNGKFMYVAGGMPIELGGEVVGAVGCSTGTPAEDSEVSQTGVEAVMEHFKKD